jgi:hypothetical protein
MEAHLIRKELWGLVTCEMDTDGKTESEIETIWEDWRKKRSKKKIADAYAEITHGHVTSHEHPRGYDEQREGEGGDIIPLLSIFIVLRP